MTPLPKRTQDELYARCRWLLNRKAHDDPAEERHNSYVHAISRATAEKVVDGAPLVLPDAVDPESGRLVIEQYPDHEPTHKQIAAVVMREFLPRISDLLKRIDESMESIAEPGWTEGQLRKKANVLEERRAGARTLLDILSEFAWILGRPDVAEKMLTPTGHAEVVGPEPYVAVARFCEAFAVKVNTQRPDGTVNHAMVHALATVRAEE